MKLLPNADQISKDLNDIKLRIAKMNARRNAQINLLQRKIMGGSVRDSYYRWPRQYCRRLLYRNDPALYPLGAYPWRSTSLDGLELDKYHDWPIVVDDDAKPWRGDVYDDGDDDYGHDDRYAINDTDDILRPYYKRLAASRTTNNAADLLAKLKDFVFEQERRMTVELLRRIAAADDRTQPPPTGGRPWHRHGDHLCPSAASSDRRPVERDSPFLNPINKKDNFCRRYNAFVKKILKPLRKSSATATAAATTTTAPTTAAANYRQPFAKRTRSPPPKIAAGNAPSYTTPYRRYVTKWSPATDYYVAAPFYRPYRRYRWYRFTSPPFLRYAGSGRLFDDDNDDGGGDANRLYRRDLWPRPKPAAIPYDVESIMRRNRGRAATGAVVDDATAAGTRTRPTKSAGYDVAAPHPSYVRAGRYDPYESDSYLRSSLPTWKQYYYTQKLKSKPSNESFLDYYDPYYDFFPDRASADDTDGGSVNVRPTDGDHQHHDREDNDYNVDDDAVDDVAARRPCLNATTADELVDEYRDAIYEDIIADLRRKLANEKRGGGSSVATTAAANGRARFTSNVLFDDGNENGGGGDHVADVCNFRRRPAYRLKKNDVPATVTLRYRRKDEGRRIVDDDDGYEAPPMTDDRRLGRGRRRRLPNAAAAYTRTDANTPPTAYNVAAPDDVRNVTTVLTSSSSLLLGDGNGDDDDATKTHAYRLRFDDGDVPSSSSFSSKTLRAIDAYSTRYPTTRTTTTTTSTTVTTNNGQRQRNVVSPSAFHTKCTTSPTIVDHNYQRYYGPTAGVTQSSLTAAKLTTTPTTTTTTTSTTHTTKTDTKYQVPATEYIPSTYGEYDRHYRLGDSPGKMGDRFLSTQCVNVGAANDDQPRPSIFNEYVVAAATESYATPQTALATTTLNDEHDDADVNNVVPTYGRSFRSSAERLPKFTSPTMMSPTRQTASTVLDAYTAAAPAPAAAAQSSRFESDNKSNYDYTLEKAFVYDDNLSPTKRRPATPPAVPDDERRRDYRVERGQTDGTVDEVRVSSTTRPPPIRTTSAQSTVTPTTYQPSDQRVFVDDDRVDEFATLAGPAAKRASATVAVRPLSNYSLAHEYASPSPMTPGDQPDGGVPAQNVVESNDERWRLQNGSSTSAGIRQPSVDRYGEKFASPTSSAAAQPTSPSPAAAVNVQRTPTQHYAYERSPQPTNYHGSLEYEDTLPSQTPSQRSQPEKRYTLDDEERTLVQLLPPQQQQQQSQPQQQQQQPQQQQQQQPQQQQSVKSDYADGRVVNRRTRRPSTASPIKNGPPTPSAAAERVALARRNSVVYAAEGKSSTGVGSTSRRNSLKPTLQRKNSGVRPPSPSSSEKRNSLPRTSGVSAVTAATAVATAAANARDDVDRVQPADDRKNRSPSGRRDGADDERNATSATGYDANAAHDDVFVDEKFDAAGREYPVAAARVKNDDDVNYENVGVEENYRRNNGERDAYPNERPSYRLDDNYAIHDRRPDDRRRRPDGHADEHVATGYDNDKDDDDDDDNGATNLLASAAASYTSPPHAYATNANRQQATPSQADHFDGGDYGGRHDGDCSDDRYPGNVNRSRDAFEQPSTDDGTGNATSSSFVQQAPRPTTAKQDEQQEQQQQQPQPQQHDQSLNSIDEEEAEQQQRTDVKRARNSTAVDVASVRSPSAENAAIASTPPTAVAAASVDVAQRKPSVDSARPARELTRRTSRSALLAQTTSEDKKLKNQSSAGELQKRTSKPKLADSKFKRMASTVKAKSVTKKA